MKPPEHMVELSKIYWRMVDSLIKNGFKEDSAKRTVHKFFNAFNPLTREATEVNT